MAKKIAINGFGRIGRIVFRNLLEKEDCEVVAINDLTDNGTLAHLFKYDTAHGVHPATVGYSDEELIINGKAIKAFAQRDPAQLPWKELGVDIVLECTGFFRDKKSASLHLEAGAKKVIISAPAKGTDVKTIVLGVNQGEITSDETVFSNASCTTNCLAPVVKILDENLGIIQGSMTTIHAYTGDQKLQDAPHADLRRSRAAAQNIVPTSTGAAVAVKLVYPPIGTKIAAIAMRVPTITGSLIDMTVRVEKTMSADDINALFKKHADGPMNGILEYTADPIVSSDIVGNKHSSIFDSGMTSTDGDFVRVVSWYDNEAGYSARLADLAMKI